MDNHEGYELIELWDVTITEQSKDGTHQKSPYQAEIKWLDGNHFEGILLHQQRNDSFKILSGYASSGPYMGSMNFDAASKDGSVRHFQGDIIDEWSIYGYWMAKDLNEQKDIKARWSAFRYEKNCFRDEEENDDSDEDSELSPNEVPCPFCDAREADCTHFLASFDITEPGEGKYGIGLIGGALLDVKIIAEFFDAVSDCYARARYKGKQSKLPKAPKDEALQPYIRAVKEVRLDPKKYNSEEGYCDDFRCDIDDYAYLVRDALLEILDYDVCEKNAATESPCTSSTFHLWFCTDANATAVMLKEKLTGCLADFKRENGIVD
jgi:hypothetical protein